MGVPTAKAPGEHSEGGLVSTAVGLQGGPRDLQTENKSREMEAVSLQP